MNVEHMHPADQLVEIMNRIYKYGMTTTSGGNLSIRDENGDIWITPSGIDKGSLTRDDIMQVKSDGACIGKHKPSVEFPFHRDIYRTRPDISGVVHAHPPVQVGFSVVHRTPDARILPELYRICGDVAQVPYHAPGTAELDADISEKFAAGYNTVLMANHGIVCGAKDLYQAFVAFETATNGGETELNALRLGGARRLTEEQLACAAEEAALPEMKGEAASDEERAARENICAFARRCYDRRLVAAQQGTISLRLTDGSMLITPGDGDMLNLKSEDIVRVKNGMREAGKKPGEAAALHQKIYAAHPQVNSIIITHAPAIMGYAVAGKKFNSGMISEGYIILGDVQHMACPNGALDEDGIVSLLGSRKNVVLVENRCAVVTGASLLNAFDRTEVLEYGAASVIAAHGIGCPVPLSQGEIDHTNQVLGL